MIHEAILAAPGSPDGFPLHLLRDAQVRQQLRAAPHLQLFLGDMRLEAQRAHETPVEPLLFSLFQLFEVTGDRAAYESVYFDRRRRMAGLALTTALDETDDYLVTLNNLIWEICNEYTWSLPAHLPVGVDQVQANCVPPEQMVDLFAAHTAHMLAEVISLLGSRLPDWLHYRVRTEIERRIFQPVFVDSRHFWWESTPMNWAAVCGGCIGMTALIMVDDREQLAGMIDRVVRTMACFLEGFGADGGCPEGIGYWVYGFGYFTYFAEMLASFTNGELDLLLGEQVSRIAAFPQVVSLGDGHYINFSDAPEHALIHPGLGSYLATHLQQPIPDLKAPHFQADPIFRWGHITRDHLWTDLNALEKPVSEGTFHLRDLIWVVDRRVWDGVTVAFAAKGGHNDEPHNHNDLGQFIIHLGGESLLADPGAGRYTRQYFGEERYDFFHTGSQGHSVPVINGQRQQAGANHDATPMSYEDRPDGLSFAVDLGRAYDNADLEKFVRSFDWSVDSLRHTAFLRLTDTFRFSATIGHVEECFISLVQPEIAETDVTWKGKAGRVTMQFSHQTFTTSLEAHETQMHNGENATFYRLCLRTQKPAKARTETFLFSCELFA